MNTHTNSVWSSGAAWRLIIILVILVAVIGFFVAASGVKVKVNELLVRFDAAISDDQLGMHDLAKSHFEAGVAHAQANEDDLALEEWNRALEFDPSFAEAYFQRGQMYFLVLDRKDKAIADFSKVIELEPLNERYFACYFLRGASYENQKNWAAAIADYSHYITLNDQPGNRIYIQMGNAHLELGDVEATYTDLAKAVAMDSADTAFFIEHIYPDLVKRIAKLPDTEPYKTKLEVLLAK